MLVRVIPRYLMVQLYNKHAETGDADAFLDGNHFISVYSTRDTSPLPDHPHVLKLMCDDLTLADMRTFTEDGWKHVTLFDEDMADKTASFIKSIPDTGSSLIVHCDAGVSRSGAIGILANRYFNEEGSSDDEKFQYDSMPWLSPNPHILMLLRPRLQRKENNV